MKTKNNELDRINKRLVEIDKAKETLKRILDLPQYYGYSEQTFEYAILHINRANEDLDFQIENAKKMLLLNLQNINTNEYHLIKQSINAYVASLAYDIITGDILLYTYFDKQLLDEFEAAIKDLVSKKEANVLLLDEINRLIVEQDNLRKEQKKSSENLMLKKIKEKFSFNSEKK